MLNYVVFDPNERPRNICGHERHQQFYSHLSGLVATYAPISMQIFIFLTLPCHCSRKWEMTQY
jgi:hypothetical protein